MLDIRVPGHRHESLSVKEPDAGVVSWKFGSDDHVTAPLFLRMYLYWICMLAGRFTVSIAHVSDRAEEKKRANAHVQMG